MEKGQEQLTIPAPTRAAAVRSIHPVRVAVPGVLMPRRSLPHAVTKRSFWKPIAAWSTTVWCR